MRTVGSAQRGSMNKEKSTSHIVATKATLITGVIEATEDRGTTTLNMTNHFMKIFMPKEENSECVIINIRNTLKIMIVDISPHE